MNIPTVPEIFRRALAIRALEPNGTYAELKARLMSDFGASPVPETAFLTIPEYDNVAPEEDWTAGLPIILRGIQNDDWSDVLDGIIISLEQIENYPKESGREDDPAKEWRNRHRSIADVEKSVMEKWMPEELMAIAKRKAGL